MCYHASVSATYEQLEKAYERPFTGSLFPSFYSPSDIVGYHFNGFNYPLMPVITNDMVNNFQIFRWGLIPSWVKDFEQANKLRASTLNARSETILEKPAFKKAALNNRCIIPVTGFFEWKDAGKQGKIPHYIYPSHGNFFSLAGIFENWFSSAENKVYQTFSILTCEANPLMKDIHSKGRMPVILDQIETENWLSNGITQTKNLVDLKPYASNEMAAHTISGLINSRKQSSNVKEVIQFFPYHSSDLFA